MGRNRSLSCMAYSCFYVIINIENSNIMLAGRRRNKEWLARKGLVITRTNWSDMLYYSCRGFGSKTWKEQQREGERGRERERGQKARERAREGNNGWDRHSRVKVKESASGHFHLLCMTALLSELANVPCHWGRDRKSEQGIAIVF